MKIHRLSCESNVSFGGKRKCQEIKIILIEEIQPEFGTGWGKSTPWHPGSPNFLGINYREHYMTHIIITEWGHFIKNVTDLNEDQVFDLIDKHLEKPLEKPLKEISSQPLKQIRSLLDPFEISCEGNLQS